MLKSGKYEYIYICIAISKHILNEIEEKYLLLMIDKNYIHNAQLGEEFLINANNVEYDTFANRTIDASKLPLMAQFNIVIFIDANPKNMNFKNKNGKQYNI